MFLCSWICNLWTDWQLQTQQKSSYATIEEVRAINTERMEVPLQKPIRRSNRFNKAAMRGWRPSQTIHAGPKSVSSFGHTFQTLDPLFQNKMQKPAFPGGQGQRRYQRKSKKQQPGVITKSCKIGHAWNLKCFKEGQRGNALESAMWWHALGSEGVITLLE